MKKFSIYLAVAIAGSFAMSAGEAFAETSQATAKAESFARTVQVLNPSKDLESAILSSQRGDILVQGPQGWYRIDRENLKHGTRMFVLGKRQMIASSHDEESN